MKLLLLHPLPLGGSIFADDLFALADETVAPTLYGAGPTIADWARAALDAVGDGPVVVVGNSIGGSCAIEIAHLAPAKVRGLVLCGTKAGHDPDPGLRDEALGVLAGDGLAAAWHRYWRPLFGPQACDAAVERGWLAASAQGASAIADGVRAFHGRADRSEFLHAWPGRVRVVSGEHDIRPERSRLLADRLPDATFHLLDGIGHYTPLEAPHELASVTADLLATLR